MCFPRDCLAFWRARQGARAAHFQQHHGFGRSSGPELLDNSSWDKRVRERMREASLQLREARRTLQTLRQVCPSWLSG